VGAVGGQNAQRALRKRKVHKMSSRNQSKGRRQGGRKKEGRDITGIIKRQEHQAWEKG